MYKTIILSVILTIFSLSAQAENRFSMSLEYQLMNSCVGSSRYRSSSKIKICACALEKTMENGWWSDYDNDYLDDKKDFKRDFSKNMKECR